MLSAREAEPRRSVRSVLVQAPRALWRPLLVGLDETQRFAPQEGNTAATSGVKALTAQGRKRGFTAILASQRIAKIDADVRGDVNNWLLGRVGQALDSRTVAGELGFSPSSAEARELRALPDRHFWGFGPALTRTPTLFRVADVATTPVKPGQAKVPTPPAPEALREILSGLAVKHEGSVCDSAQVADRSDQSAELSDLRVKLAAMTRGRDHWRAVSYEQDRRISAAREALAFVPQHEVPAQGGGCPEVDDGQTSRAATLPAASGSAKPQRARPEPQVVTARKDGASPAAIAIADLLDRVNPARLTWSQAATMTGRKASGGNFNAARKWLRGSGRIVEDGDFVRSASDAPAGLTREEALRLWSTVLTNPAPRMIAAFASHGALTKTGLGEAIGAAPHGGNFNNGLAQLRRNGVVVEAGGAFRLAAPLPGEAG